MKLNLVKMLMNLRKHWGIEDFKDAYSDEWIKIPTKLGDCFNMMEEYLTATYDISYLEEVIKDELTTFNDSYNAKVQEIVEEQEAKLVPMYIEYIKNKVDSLVGVTFSTGHLDDLYQIDKVVDDEIDGLTLIVFFTWEGEGGEKNGLGIDELGFDQLQEIFDEISSDK
jgi:hypothetical protein